MFSFLSKKIALQNQSELNCIAWSKTNDYIAVGGDSGILKLLKFENDEGTTKKPDQKTSYNQSLNGHENDVYLLRWNEHYNKLTSCDKTGLIIVWAWHENQWYEEMINNRHKSNVVDLKWSPDDSKICIVYEDGAAVLGSVSGQRIWWRENKNTKPKCFAWSPNSSMLLFGYQNGGLNLFDEDGNFSMQVDVKVCLDNGNYVVSIEWFTKVNGTSQLPLAVIFENGQIQMMADELDCNPTIVFTGMTIKNAAWNHDGAVLVVCGCQEDGNIIHYYGSSGDHLGILQIPAGSINSIAWEKNSKRLAIIVDNFIYFATVKMEFTWCYFKDTILLSYDDKKGTYALFWNIIKDTVIGKFFQHIKAVAGFGDYCVILIAEARKSKLLLCNNIGTNIDAQNVDDEIEFIAMSSVYVVGASKNNFLLWQYKTPKSPIYVTSHVQIRIFHIDSDTGQEYYKASSKILYTIDPICSVCISNVAVIFGRESGILQYYTLPDLVLISKFKLDSKPLRLCFNCNSTRLAIRDIFGALIIADISVITNSSGDQSLKAIRKDVWSLRWSSDDPNLLAVVEKNQLFICNNLEAEEGIQCYGHLFSFDDLKISAILLDNLMLSLEDLSTEFLVTYEAGSLRNIRALLAKDSYREALEFAETKNHPTIWKLLSKSALQRLDLETAEVAFVNLKDYAGILFLKKLAAISDTANKKARVEMYYKNYAKAEEIYIEANRIDLAFGMYKTLGVWDKTVKYLESGLSSDVFVQDAYNYFAQNCENQGRYLEALEYYEMARNRRKIIECLYNMEDYGALEAMIENLTEGDVMLKYIGDLLSANAVCNSAVKAYIKSGDINSALDLCILHSRWGQAFNIAKSFELPQVFALFSKYNELLLQKGQLKLSITINIHAKNYRTAAEYVGKLARTISKRQPSNLLQLKKLYVFSGGLLEIGGNPGNNPDEKGGYWKGAEAFHYFMLSQRHMYAGNFHLAMVTSCKLRDYISYIPEVDVYTAVALSACIDGSFSVCSKALIKLKSLQATQYDELALKIFSIREPRDLAENTVKCLNCPNLVPDWSLECPKCYVKYPTCVASGRRIIEEVDVWKCNNCHNVAINSYIELGTPCPLCHMNEIGFRNSN